MRGFRGTKSPGRRYGVDHRPQYVPDGVGDDAGALDVRMDAVRLVQPRLPCHLVEEERQQLHVVLSSEVAIHLTECYGVLGSEYRGRLHSGEQPGDPLLLRALDDPAQVL